MPNKIVYLRRRESFSASHRLLSSHLSEAENKKLFGKCYGENGHGHNYVLEVTLRGGVDEKTGVLMNLTELKGIIQKSVLERVDHKHLNMDVPEFKNLNPTTENLAMLIWTWLSPEIPKGLLYEVALHETENNVAIYRGE